MDPMGPDPEVVAEAESNRHTHQADQCRIARTIMARRAETGEEQIQSGFFVSSSTSRRRMTISRDIGQYLSILVFLISINKSRIDTPYFASYAVLPPTTVRSTFVPRICSGGILVRSRSSTTKSARYPGAITPFSFSANSP